MMRLRQFGLAAALALGLVASPVGQLQFDAGLSRQLADSLQTGGRSYQYVSDLTETVGSRVTGSAAYERAVEWAVAQFRAAGIDRVTVEPFTIARAWERGSARARIASPLERSLHVESLGWAPSTPEEGIEAEVIVVPSQAPERIAAQASLRGRIAMMTEFPASATVFEPVPPRDRVDARLRRAGAVAILWPDTSADNELSARATEFGTEIGVLPSAQIGRDDAEEIRGLLRKGPVRIALTVQNRVSPGPVTVNNVVAEIRGREEPGEWVVAGAHLDSWDFGTGAQDNGTGVAMVLDAARAIAALGRPPRRSIRFVLWGGEEQGLVGSMAYVRAHRAELAQCIAAINTDGGSGRVRGFLTPGRQDVADAMRPVSDALLARLGAAGLDRSLRYAFESDDGTFLLQGIPALDLDADEASYEEIHHKASDTIAKVDRNNLAVGAAAVGIAAYVIADAPRPIAPHLDRAAFAAMLRAAGIDRPPPP
jgi:hypothetical protein